MNNRCFRFKFSPSMTHCQGALWEWFLKFYNIWLYKMKITSPEIDLISNRNESLYLGYSWNRNREGVSKSSIQGRQNTYVLSMSTCTGICDEEQPCQRNKKEWWHLSSTFVSVTLWFKFPSAVGESYFKSCENCHPTSYWMAYDPISQET